MYQNVFSPEKRKNIKSFKWASSWENLSYAIHEQHRCRSACVSAQSEQRLYYLLSRQYDTYTCYIQTFKSLCSWASRFESNLLKNPEDRFSRDGAQMYQVYNCDETKIEAKVTLIIRAK